MKTTRTKKLTGNQCLLLFVQNEDECNKFDRIEHKLSQREEVHVLMMLDQLFPGNYPIIHQVERETVYFNFDLSDLAKVATETQIIDLIRCGLCLDDECVVMHF